MNDQTTLERNLLALSGMHPALASALNDSDYDPRFLAHVPGSATDGQPIVPGVREGNRDLYFHSRFDPVREGRRVAESFTKPGYYLFLGLGAGYHILPFVSRASVSQIFIVDFGLPLVKSILARVDLRRLFLDPRMTLVVDPGPDELRERLLSTFLPALTGDLSSVPLRGRVSLDRSKFEEAAKVIRDTMNTAADDYTVQSHFGKKWFANIVANLDVASRSHLTLRPIRNAYVVAAGPSLEAQAAGLRKVRNEGTVIATDTALPALAEMGIRADMVISIDCQHVSYYHFLSGYPENVPLILDLASPPGLTRLTSNPAFFSSGHPFVRYISAHYRRFPELDTSGGNVTHAAVSLAAKLGARTIHLYGADYSYPQGKTYARGTYVYPYFHVLARRTASLESLLFAFLLRHDQVMKEWDGGQLRYLTYPLTSYRDRLVESFVRLDCDVIPVASQGLRIPVHHPPHRSEQRTERPSKDPTHSSQRPADRVFFSAGPAEGSWKDFVGEYASELRALPKPRGPYGVYIHSLSARQRDLWTTLYPISAVLRRRLFLTAGADGGTRDPGVSLLADARDWALDVLGRYAR